MPRREERAREGLPSAASVGSGLSEISRASAGAAGAVGASASAGSASVASYSYSAGSSSAGSASLSLDPAGGGARDREASGAASLSHGRPSMVSVYSESTLSSTSSNAAYCAICQGPMNMPPSTTSALSTPKERAPLPRISRRRLPLVVQLRHARLAADAPPQRGLRGDVREVQSSGPAGHAGLPPPAAGRGAAGSASLAQGRRGRRGRGPGDSASSAGSAAESAGSAAGSAGPGSAAVNDPAGEASPTDIVTLPCNHTYHRECFLRWLHFDNCTCPLCRAPVDLQGVEPWTWRLRNIAVRTRCSPESLRLGLRPDGWFNIQLQVVPPPGRTISRVRYVFHPAFSLNKLEVSHPPFDLVMKLVSNAVDLVIEVACTDGSVFTFVHSLVKELCNRVYFEGIFNGSADGEKLIDASHYFDSILETYHRPKDYYGVEMEPPPRFRERRTGNAFTRFFNNLFNG